MEILGKNAVIGVVGAGAMGSGIAHVAASSGHSVVLYDAVPSGLERGIEKISKDLKMLTEKGKITQSDADSISQRISKASDLEGLKNCDLIIEAIVEDLEIKKNVFKKLENIVKDETVLASNTSSLSITSIAAACKRPERVIGIHFFNPATILPLVEIIPAVQTHPDLADKCKSLIVSWKKVPVIAKDTPGFIVNRIARPFYGEAIRIYEEGIADFATIDWVMRDIGGFKMGPFELMDLIGNDVNYKVTETVWTQLFFDPKYKPSLTQKRLYEAGYFGRKSGRGYYDYAEGAVKPEPKKDAELGRKIFDRIIAMLINEAADALLFNIASRQDIELAMTKGVNYPKGLLAWADEIGVDKITLYLEELQYKYAEDRYRCSPVLKQYANTGWSFIS
jgi:3-hydroxybutyryl-CoA dehydrogenase